MCFVLSDSNRGEIRYIGHSSLNDHRQAKALEAAEICRQAAAGEQNAARRAGQGGGVKKTQGIFFSLFKNNC